jgi:hypothetical protein
VADEVGQVAAVVDVGVAEHDRVDAGRGEREARAAGAGLPPLAAGGAAVEEDSLATNLDQMHGAGDGLSGAPEGYGRVRSAAVGVRDHNPIVPRRPCGPRGKSQIPNPNLVWDLGFGIWDLRRRRVLPPKPEKVEREKWDEPTEVVLLVHRPFVTKLSTKSKPESGQEQNN